MSLNYDLYRMNQNFYGSTLTQEEIKQWIFNNIFITKIGQIKTFDHSTQKGVVIIKEFDNLEIETQNISNININPSKGELVLLLQSSINLFNEDDNVNFDKNHFYILSIINPKYLEMACGAILLKATNKLELKSDNQIDINAPNTNINSSNTNINNDNTNLNAKQNITINCNDLTIKSNDDISLNANDDTSINANYNLDLIGRNKVLIKSSNKIDIRNDSESLRSILIDITYAIANLRVTGQAIIDESSRAGLYGLRSRIYDLLN